MKYIDLAMEFIREQEDDGLSFAGIPAVAVKKFAEWLDEREVNKINFFFAGLFLGQLTSFVVCIIALGKYL